MQTMDSELQTPFKDGGCWRVPGSSTSILCVPAAPGTPRTVNGVERTGGPHQPSADQDYSHS